MVNGVEEIEKFPGAVRVAEFGEGHRGPDGGVGVLSAVFAHTGNVTFDVAGVEV